MSTTAPAGPDTASAPARRSTPLYYRVLKPLASLQLTVTLFAFAIGLIFLGTLAQKTGGIWTAIDRYFWTWVAMVDVQPLVEFGKIFFELPKSWQAPSWAQFPFPGGKLIGGLMFLNLIAAHAMRFQLTWKRAGIWMAHAGLLLLFVGEAITRECQVEQRMTIKEGESVNFTEDSRDCELAFTAPAPNGEERVIVVPASLLKSAAKTGRLISDEALPVDIRVKRYMVNSEYLGAQKIAALKADGQTPPENPATGGLGTAAVVREKPEVSGVGAQEMDIPSTYVTLLRKGTEQLVGTYLASLWFTYNPFDRDTEEKQAVDVDGTQYNLALRYTRYYKPFSLTLEKFRFDRYVGTSEAKNYSSDLKLIDPERGQNRDVHIAMNEPLRYRGETFYQQNFDKTTEKATILQVVRNPGWLLPYFACAMVGIGLVFHFLLTLTRYLSRRRKPSVGGAAVEPLSPFQRYFPVGVVGLAGLMLLGQAMPKHNRGKMDLEAAARIPVVDGGRVKPLDTVGRVYLRKISGREEFVGEDGEMHPAIEWVMDALSTPSQSRGESWKHKVIRIENDQVRDLLQLPRREGFRYSIDEIRPKIEDLQRAVDKVRARPGAKASRSVAADARIEKFFESGDRDVFGAQLIEVAERIEAYTKLTSRAIPLLLPPSDGQDWHSLGDLENSVQRAATIAALDRHGILPKDLSKITEAQANELDDEIATEVASRLAADPNVARVVAVLSAYRIGDPTRFTDALNNYRETLAAAVPLTDRAKVEFEVFLNEFAPAYQVIKLYIFALLLSFASWMVLALNPSLSDALRRGAFWLLLTTFLLHGFALVSRMYLMDRPLVFVTNLYSTAVFIGWAAVGLGLVLERIFPVGLGNMLAAVVGGATAIIAHNLATSGDTLEMMQAVLDTNFWLATHVTTINLGYSATYVAGVGGLIYIILGVFTTMLRRPTGLEAPGTARKEDLGRVLGQVIYGVLCVATLTSFVGTVLGGIWADQSWGRFWGWDPKENGAVLIVIWNALILHARWCGLVKDRGVAVLTLVGSMITTWSYFGTNQLGVGLHNYGFNKSLAFGCMVTWMIHLGLIGVGLLPLKYWRSFAPAAADDPRLEPAS